MGNRHGIHATATSKREGDARMMDDDETKTARRSRHHRRRRSDESHLMSSGYHRRDKSAQQETTPLTATTPSMPHHVSESHLRMHVFGREEEEVLEHLQTPPSQHAIFEMDVDRRNHTSGGALSSETVLTEKCDDLNNGAATTRAGEWLRNDATPDNTPPLSSPTTTHVALESVSHIKIVVTDGEKKLCHSPPARLVNMLRSISSPSASCATGNTKKAIHHATSHKMIAEPIAIVLNKNANTQRRRRSQPQSTVVSVSSEVSALCHQWMTELAATSSTTSCDINQQEHHPGVYSATVYPQQWTTIPSPSSFVFDTPPSPMIISLPSASSATTALQHDLATIESSSATMSGATPVALNRHSTTLTLQEEMYHLRHFMDNLLYNMDMMDDTMKMLKGEIQRLDVRIGYLQQHQHHLSISSK